MAGWFVVDNSQDEALLSSSKRSLPAPESIGTTMMMRDIKHAEVQQQVASSDKPEASDVKAELQRG
eukprot:scaffold26084_cov80-Skeletonema_marinoi.AAC.3